MDTTLTITLVGSTKYVRAFSQVYEGLQDINDTNDKLFHTFPRLAVHQPSIYSHALGIELSEEQEIECARLFRKYIDESQLIIAMAKVDPEVYGELRKKNSTFIIPVGYGDYVPIRTDCPDAVYIPFGEHTMLDLEYAQSKGVKILYRTFMVNEPDDLVPSVRWVDWNCRNIMNSKNFYSFIFDRDKT